MDGKMVKDIVCIETTSTPLCAMANFLELDYINPGDANACGAFGFGPTSDLTPPSFVTTLYDAGVISNPAITFGNSTYIGEIYEQDQYLSSNWISFPTIQASASSNDGY